jgi:hypothetical protein
MVMSRTSSTAQASEASWRRPRYRQVVLTAVTVLAVLTGVQGLEAVPSGAQGGGAEGDGLLVTTSEALDQDIDPGAVHRPPLLPPLADPDRALAEGTTLVPSTDDAALPPADEEPILTHAPRIRLQQGERTVDDPVRVALEVPGVTFATSVDIGELTITSEDGSTVLRVAAVDPNGFRVMTPQVTASYAALWERIADGDAAFTHDVGTRLALELGSRVPAGTDEETTVRVGAYASNGVPPIADVVVSHRTAAELGVDGEATLLVAIASDADVAAVTSALAASTGMEPDVIEEPATRRAFLTGAAARDAFEPFSYVSIGDGMIQIDQDWISRNITSATVPVFRGHVTCHRLLIPQLRGALEQVVAEGLDDLIDPSQYGGCWVPRHILFDPSRPLSMHSWGLAVDFNVRGNEYGNRDPEMDRRIVEIFERWGFVWGGNWSTPDGMHFELGALLGE